MTTYHRLDLSEVGDVTIVRFRDARLTETRGIEETAQELFGLIENEDCRKIIVNLASTDCMSSSALGKLIVLAKKVKARGGMLKLSNMNRDLAMVFSVTRLDSLFEIEKDERNALAAFEATEPGCSVTSSMPLQMPSLMAASPKPGQCLDRSTPNRRVSRSCQTRVPAGRIDAGPR